MFPILSWTLGLTCGLASWNPTPAREVQAMVQPRPPILADRNRNCVFCHIGDPKDHLFTEQGQRAAERRAAARAAGKDPGKMQ